MDGCTSLDVTPPAYRLFMLAERCLIEPASRRLDGEIYCAVHHIMDMNGLDTHNLCEAKENGDVLVSHREAAIGWVEAPPFTAELKYAETLLPDGVVTILKDPRLVCAAALRARALSEAPPLYVSNLLDARQG